MTPLDGKLLHTVLCGRMPGSACASMVGRIAVRAVAAFALMSLATAPAPLLAHGAFTEEKVDKEDCFAPQYTCFRLKGSANPPHDTAMDLEAHGYTVGLTIYAAQGSPNQEWVIARNGGGGPPDPPDPPQPPQPPEPPEPGQPGVPPTVSLSAVPNPVDDGDAVTVTARLSSALESAVTIPLTLRAGTAEPEDYGALGGVTIAAGRTSGTGTIATAIDDDPDDETFTVALGVLPEAVRAGDPASVVVTIADGDLLRLSIADAPAVAEGSTARFVVTLDAPVEWSVTVSYRTHEGTAATGQDFVGRSGTLVFEPGETERFVEVATREDALDEDDESFTVKLSGAGGATLEDDTGIGIIVDDDAAPAPALPSLAITDATAAEGGTARFTVALSPASAEGVSVGYRTAGGTATEGTDYDAATGTLTFAPNTTRQTIAVRTRADDLAEPDEAFTVTLSAPTGAILADASGTGTITDDDMRPPVSIDRELLADLGRALAFGAVRCRIDRAFSDAARVRARPAARAALSLAPPVRSFARDALEDPIERSDGDRAAPDAEEMLGNVSFLLPLTGDGGGARRLAAWGCGEYRSLAGDGGGDTGAWEGEAFSMQVGADMVVGRDLFAGVSLSRSRGSLDFGGASTTGQSGGGYELRLTGVHPYLGWWVSPGIELWGTVGLASGDLRIADDAAGSWRTSGARLASGTVGIEGGLYKRGGTAVRLKGEWALAQLDIEGGSAGLRDASVELQRLRLAAEVEHEGIVPHVGVLAPWGELGLRHDGGDGGGGAGLEVGGGLHYGSIERGWTAEFSGRWLAVHGAAVPDEWGLGLRLHYDPGPPGFGSWVSLSQSWGGAAIGAPRMWEDGLSDLTAHGLLAERLEVEAGHGFRAFAGGGTLTPFGAMGLESAGARSYRTGVRLAPGPSSIMSLEAERREGTPAGHAIMVRGVARF